jgi:UDP-N-acetylglucosamine 2-epimerase (non-hydrolysing)
MIHLERCILGAKPDLVLTPGDTNTTLATALSAAKLNVPIGHIEAGARSYDMSMPEEVNRIVTDHVSSMLFAPTKNAARNLLTEGISRRCIHLVGDTMVDALIRALPAALRLKTELLSGFDTCERDYVLVTAHRQGNVDDSRRLRSIVEALMEISKRIRVLFPAHPRTANRLKTLSFMSRLRRSPGLTLTKAVGYLENVALLDGAAAVLTDSGGMQKESFLLGAPCATMRHVTEWPETLTAHANRLVDADRTRIVDGVLTMVRENGRRRRRIYSRNPFGDGKASNRIARTVLEAVR